MENQTGGQRKLSLQKWRSGMQIAGSFWMLIGAGDAMLTDGGLDANTHRQFKVAGDDVFSRQND